MAKKYFKMNGTKIVVEIIETQIKSIPLHMGLQEYIRFELQTANIVKCAKCFADLAHRHSLSSTGFLRSHSRIPFIHS